MSILLILLIIMFAVGAGVALVRGLLAFSDDAARLRSGGDDAGDLRRGEKQNRMMMQRVMFQGAAILLVAVLGLIAAKN